MCSRPLALANVHYTSAQSSKSISPSRYHGDSNANVRALFVQLGLRLREHSNVCYHKQTKPRNLNKCSCFITVFPQLP